MFLCEFYKAIKIEFVCKVRSVGNGVINKNVEKVMNLNDGDCIESVKRFRYLGDRAVVSRDTIFRSLGLVSKV